MRSASLTATLLAFVGAGLFALGGAWFAARVIEDSSANGVRAELDVDGITWAQVDANGLQLFLIGTAPTEAARFDALTAAGRVVDAARVIDQMDVAETQAIAPPRFSIEILRNDTGVSLFGLIPAGYDREVLLRDVGRAVDEGTAITDLLETAAFPTPDNWAPSVGAAIEALGQLPRSKVSVSAGLVEVTAMTDSREEKARLESALARSAPDGVRLALDLSAPRPVISPFTMRFVVDADGTSLEACSAASDEGRDRILRAVSAAGHAQRADCLIGLGVPTRTWPDAVEMSLGALTELGQGQLTITDADISLVAAQGTDQALFDRVVGELEGRLPDVFALTAVLPEPPDPSDQGPPEFTATLSPEGGVQLRGRVASELSRMAIDSYAKASFGSSEVRMTARIDDDLPPVWQVKVLAAIEALASLANGSVQVTPDVVSVSGVSGSATAQSDITALLSDKIGEGQRFDLNVRYDERLDPLLGIPTPQECEARIAEILSVQKINFEPGSAVPDAPSLKVIDEIAELLRLCRDIPLEIQGHTDSQGREIMNEQLSQERADAVLEKLRDRRVLTANFRAKGYGEAQPIADNGTEAGRDANRRIEFKLIGEDGETTAEATEDAGEEGTESE